MSLLSPQAAPLTAAHYPLMTVVKGAAAEHPAGGITHPSSPDPPRGLIKARGDVNQRHTPGAGTSHGQRSVNGPLYFSIPDGPELDTDVKLLKMACRCLAAAFPVLWLISGVTASVGASEVSRGGECFNKTPPFLSLPLVPSLSLCFLQKTQVTT